MNTNSQEIVLSNAKQAMDYLTAHEESVVKVAARGLDGRKLSRMAAMAFARDPKLIGCTGKSILMSVIHAAQLGLQIGWGSADAYLVPFFNKDAKVREAQLLVGYRGIIKMASRGGGPGKFDADVVYEQDEFDYEQGTNEFLRHKPAFGERGRPTHVWAMATWPNGQKKFIVMSASEVEKIRQVSNGRDSAPWRCNWPEMAKKTAIHRLGKTVPLSDEATEAIRYVDESEFNYDESPAGAPAVVPPRRLKDWHPPVKAAPAEAPAYPEGDGDDHPPNEEVSPAPPPAPRRASPPSGPPTAVAPGAVPHRPGRPARRPAPVKSPAAAPPLEPAVEDAPTATTEDVNLENDAPNDAQLE